MNCTVGVSTFGRADRVVETVGAMHGLPVLVNVNDADEVLAGRLSGLGVETVLSAGPQLFWEGMVSLVEHARTEWLLITSDEDAVLPAELPGLVAFAEAREAGVVAAPVWSSGLFKPWPESWASRLTDDRPLHPSHFHDISGYISGTLLHRPTAAKHLATIRRLAPVNDYVCIYTVPALVALIGMDRPAFVYPKPVTVMGPALPGQKGVRGSEYWQPESRRQQNVHLAEFIDHVGLMDAGYAELLRQGRVYERRRWV